MDDPADIEVDARGHRCPTPTLRLRRALERASPRQRVLLKADDPMARIDVPHFAAQANLRLVQSWESDGVLHFLVEKS